MIRSKEIFLSEKEAEDNNPMMSELHNNTFCTKCKINWAKLSTSDDGDSDFEFCPQCNSDVYLIKGKIGDAFIYVSLEGKIKSVYTGKELKSDPVKFDSQLPMLSNSHFDHELWEKLKEEKQLKEEAKVNQYISESQLIGEEKAREKYLSGVYLK